MLQRGISGFWPPVHTKRDFSVLLILRCASFTSHSMENNFISFSARLELRNFLAGFWVIECNGSASRTKWSFRKQKPIILTAQFALIHFIGGLRDFTFCCLERASTQSNQNKETEISSRREISRIGRSNEAWASCLAKYLIIVVLIWLWNIYSTTPDILPRPWLLLRHQNHVPFSSASKSSLERDGRPNVTDNEVVYSFLLETQRNFFSAASCSDQIRRKGEIWKRTRVKGLKLQDIIY